MTCPLGWMREYHGYLMPEEESHQSKEFICVDHNPDTVAGGVADQNGALFNLVEGILGKQDEP